MPTDLRALFPEELASDLLDIVGRTDELRTELPRVSFAVNVVRGMLGNHGAVEAAKAVWNEHAVARIVESQRMIKDSRPTLEAYWQGPASRAYAVYAADVVERIDAVVGKLEQVSAALGTVLDTITRQYKAAVTALVTVASEVADLAGTFTRRVPSESVADALAAIGTFLEEIGAYLGQAIDSMNDYAQSIHEIRNVVATMQIPTPVRLAAPGIGTPTEWHLREGREAF